MSGPAPARMASRCERSCRSVERSMLRPGSNGVAVPETRAAQPAHGPVPELEDVGLQCREAPLLDLRPDRLHAIEGRESPAGRIPG